MGRRQRAEHGEADPGRLARIQRALHQPLAQRLAAHQLHHDPGAAVLDHHVMDGDDGGVVDPGRGTRFALHPLVDGLPLTLGEIVGDARLLDRDIAVHDLVMGQPYGAHTSVAEAGDELIAAADEPPAVRVLGPGGGLLCGVRLSGGRLGAAARIGEPRRLVPAPRRPRRPGRPARLLGPLGRLRWLGRRLGRLRPGRPATCGGRRL